MKKVLSIIMIVGFILSVTFGGLLLAKYWDNDIKRVHVFVFMGLITLNCNPFIAYLYDQMFKLGEKIIVFISTMLGLKLNSQRGVFETFLEKRRLTIYNTAQILAIVNLVIFTSMMWLIVEVFKQPQS